MNDTLSHRLTRENEAAFVQAAKDACEVTELKSSLDYYKTAPTDEELKHIRECFECTRDVHEAAIVQRFVNELASLRQQLTALQAAQEWREIEKEKPPRSTDRPDYSVVVEVARWSPILEDWQRGHDRYNLDYRVDAMHSCLNAWLNHSWTHWKPLGEHPKP